MKKKEFISSYGLFATIVSVILGTSIFSYPNELANIVGNDGWIVIIINGVLAFLLFYIIYKIMELNNYNDFYTILSNNLGKTLGVILALSLAIYNVIVISLNLRIFTEEVKMYLLETTPVEFIFIVTIFTALYMIRGEVETLVNFNEITFLVMLISIVFILIFSAYKADFTNILPILNNKPDDYMKAVFRTTYRYLGIQIAFLILPFVKNRKNINRVAVKSVVLIVILCSAVSICVISVFGLKQTKLLLWPTITMVKSIDIPGAFIERWEGIIMAIWIMFYFTTCVNLYYFAADIIKNIIKTTDIKVSSSIIVPFIYLIALYPSNIAELYEISRVANPILFFFNIVFLPIVLFTVSYVKKGRWKKS